MPSDTAMHDGWLIDELIKALERLDLCSDATYDPVYAARDRLDTITRHAATFDRDGAATLEAVTRSIANDPSDYPSVITRLLGAAIAKTEGVSETVQLALDRAQTMAIGDMIRTFRNLSRHTLNRLDETLAGIVQRARANAIPVGIQDIEVATRSGLAEQWLELERVEADFVSCENILKKMGERKWAQAGIIWRNAEKLDGLASVKRGAGGVYLAAAVVAGAAPILATGDQWAQARRQRTAQEEVDARRAKRDAARRGEAERADAAAAVTHPKPNPLKVG